MQEYCVYGNMFSWDERRQIETANKYKPSGKRKVVVCYKDEWPKRDHSCSHISTQHRPKNPSKEFLNLA